MLCFQDREKLFSKYEFRIWYLMDKCISAGNQNLRAIGPKDRLCSVIGGNQSGFKSFSINCSEKFRVFLPIIRGKDRRINHTGICTNVNKPDDRNKFMKFERKD